MRPSKAPVLLILAVSLVMSFVHVKSVIAVQNDGESQVMNYEENVIIPEVTSTLDDYGRPPLFRLTLNKGCAGVGPEDLPTPFTAYVESGTITYRDSSGESTELGPGARVAIDSGDEYSLRNADCFMQATLLVLVLPGSCRTYVNDGYVCMPPFLPYEFLCEDPCRPDITNTLLFQHPHLIDKFQFARFSATSVLIPAKQIVESLDLGGDSELIRLYVRVEAGSVVTFNGYSYASGDEFVAQSDEPLVAGESGAELIVLRVAVALESE